MSAPTCKACLRTGSGVQFSLTCRFGFGSLCVECEKAGKEPAAEPPAKPKRWGADEIRAEFKRHGFGARQVSVRTGRSSIDVTVKTAMLPLAWARSVAERAEKIDRCEMTGEILCGGNTYVSVRHDDATVKLLASRYASAVAEALGKVSNGDRFLQPVAGSSRPDGSAVCVGRPHAYTVSAWFVSGPKHYNEHAGVAHDIAYDIAIQDPDQLMPLVDGGKK